MSYASGTPFLNLPQTVGSDHRDWFDTNEAFLDLDTKMKTLWDGSSSTETILTALQESVATLSTDVTTLSGIVSGHTSTITTINESLVLINTTLNALNTQVVGKFDSVGIADAYDATYGVYSVGDVVTYNGQRYVCTTAVTAAEPFDVSKWTAQDVQTVLDGIESAISGTHPTITWSIDGTLSGTFSAIGQLRIIATTIALNVTASLAQYAAINVGTLASGDRPTIPVDIPFTTYGGVSGVMTLAIDGTIALTALSGSIAGGDTIYLDGAYVTF